MQYCIEHIEENLDLSFDPIKKDLKLNISQVQSYVDAYEASSEKSSKLEYRNFGMFTRSINMRRE